MQLPQRSCIDFVTIIDTMEGALAWSGNWWYDAAMVVTIVTAVFIALSSAWERKSLSIREVWNKTFYQGTSNEVALPLYRSLVAKILLSIEITFIVLCYLYSVFHESLSEWGFIRIALLFTGGMILFYLTRVCIYLLLGKVYLSTAVSHSWIVSYRYIELGAVYILFPVMVVACIPSCLKALPILFLSVMALWRIAVVIISLRAFRDNSEGSLPLFFLYLCSHELMPFLLCLVAYSRL